jgi:hypothetical protein
MELFQSLTKGCTHCLETKPVTEFYVRKSRKNKARESWCRGCHGKQNSERHLKTQKWKTEYEKERGWRRRGILNKAQRPFLMQDFRDLFLEQGFACRICRSQFFKFARMLNVDHDHKTGKARGLLCFKCNKGLGHFADSPEVLERAADYLRVFGGSYET